MIYDVAPGQCIQVPDDRILDVDEIADASKRLEKGDSLDKVAKKLGGKVYTPSEPQPTTHVMVDQEMLVAALGEEKAAKLLHDSKPGKQRGA